MSRYDEGIASMIACNSTIRMARKAVRFGFYITINGLQIMADLGCRRAQSWQRADTKAVVNAPSSCTWGLE
jgi:hypothetical protein